MNRSQKYLRDFVKRSQRENRNARSIRAVSRRLKYSPSFVSQILSGKKRIPIQRAVAIGRAFGMDPAESAHLKQLLRSDLLGDLGETKALEQFSRFKTQDEKMSVVLRDWYHLAILDLSTCSHFQSSPKWIATQLNLGVRQVEESIRVLVALGLMKKKEGRLVKTSKKIRFSASDATLKEIQSYHRMMAKKVDTLLRHAPSRIDGDYDKRLITGITVACNPKQIALARQKLNETLHEIANLLSEGECTEVYQVSGQLFPLTR